MARFPLSSRFVPAPVFSGLLSLFIILLMTETATAQSASGGLRGMVLDADFSVPVAGAAVVLEGSNQSASTGEDGSFFINDIPPGQYAVLISKEGFIRERRGDIVISSGSVKEIDLEMTAEVVELDEFVVSQEEIVDTSSAAVSVDIRKDLKSFTDVLGAQFIAQTGASDAAKLLAKSTGVNVADGKFVVVRGLSDRYNSVTLNGLRVPSSDPDRRAVALDLFPSAVIQDVRTNKTFLPNMPGEATGAGIDIKTKSVPEKNFYNFKVGTGFNTNVTGDDGFLSYKGGGTGMFGTSSERSIPGFLKAADLPGPGQDGYTDTPADKVLRQRINDTLSPVMGTEEKSAPVDFTLEASMGIRGEFMGAPAGLTVAVDYSKKYTGNDDDQIGRYFFSEAAGDLGLVNQIRRQAKVHNGQETMRAGMLVSLGIELDTDSQITATYFFNRVAEDRASLQYGVDPDQNAGVLDYRESILYTERQLRVFQLEGSHLLDHEHDFKFDWALSYNQSSQLEPDSRFVNARVDEGTGNFFQPPLSAVPPFQRFWRELQDENYTARMDIETRILGDDSDSGPNVKMKFGGLLDYSDRAYRADSFAYSTGFDNPGFPATAMGPFPGFPGFAGKPKLFPEQTWGDVFLTGNVPITSVSTSTFGTFLFRTNDAETYAASQMISAGYLMFDADLGGGLNVSFGARAETTDLKTLASPIYTYLDEPVRFALLSAEQRNDLVYQQLVNDAFGGDVTAQNDPRLEARRRANISEMDILPALSATWDYAESQRLRGAVSRTIARPSFKEISPVAFVNVESGDIFVGNADLQTSDIMNYDTRWEWFPEPGAMIGVSFFAKLIDRPIEFSQDGDIQRFINVESGRVYGMELEFQRGLGFITEELSHFSVGANYSYIQSSATRPEVGRQSIYGPTRRLQGQPDYIFNANLTYDNPDTGWSFGTFLNVVGPQLFAVAFNYQDPDILQEPFTTLDVSVSKKLGKNTKLTFRAQNLLNETMVRYYNNPQRPIHSTRSPGINYSVSLSLNW